MFLVPPGVVFFSVFECLILILDTVCFLSILLDEEGHIKLTGESPICSFTFQYLISAHPSDLQQSQCSGKLISMQFPLLIITPYLIVSLGSAAIYSFEEVIYSTRTGPVFE